MSALLAAALAITAVPETAPAWPEHVIYSDEARSVAVRYDFTPLGVEFSARLPAGWSFSVGVDGNQDGIWGDGPFGEHVAISPTPDRRFGQDSRNGVFCSQYVLQSYASDPDRIYASSECGGLPSHGSVLMSGFDDRMWAPVTLRIPLDEIFGTLPDAHLQVCVWDTQQRTCQHSPRQPFVLRRPATPADQTSAGVPNEGATDRSRP